MNLTVIKDGESVNELQFDNGPIRIGREIGSEVFLPDSSVSRKHAVIYNNDDNEWVFEDLHSANGTRINGKEIWKSTIKTGDVISIACFDINVKVVENKVRPRASHLEDTMVDGLDVSESIEIRSRDIITRSVTSDDSPMLRINNDKFRKIRAHLSELLMIDDLHKLMEYFTRTVLKEFHACHCWTGILDKNAAIVNMSYGRNRDTTNVAFEDIMLNNHIIYSVKERQHVLVPRMLRTDGRANLRSALIVSFALSDNTFFAAYADNTCEHEHYTITDLDYLMLLGDILVARIDSLLQKG